MFKQPYISNMHKLCKKIPSINNNNLRNYGMMRAPRRAMESLVALALLNLGRNIPLAISFTLGFACTITEQKQPPTTSTSIPIAISNFLIYTLQQEITLIRGQNRLDSTIEQTRTTMSCHVMSCLV